MSGEKVSADGGAMGALLQVALSDGTSKRLRRAISAYYSVSTAWRLGQAAWKTTQKQVAYTVSIPSTDDIYADIHAWLLAELAPRRRRAVLAQSTRERSGEATMSAPTSGNAPPARVHQFYDGSRIQTVRIAGHRVRVEVEKDSSEGGGSGRRWRVEKIIFTAYGMAGRDAVVAFLEEVTRERFDAKRPPSVSIATRWGDWRTQPAQLSRSIESVVLREGQKEALLDDLRQFLAAEAAYVRLGIPYHRGYLLHGPPGTGKTSIAKALAAAAGLDVYYMPLSDFEADASLLNLVGGVQPGSMLLLEDIDVLHAATHRDDERKGVSLSGLLNALDGVATPHGLITVMTTNNIEVLDAALVRTGRVDYPLEVGFLTDEQAERLVEVLVGERVDLPSVAGREFAPADVVEVVKRHLRDPAQALVAVKELLA